MSFRTEDKFTINFEDISKLKKFFEKKSKKIFPDRNISLSLISKILTCFMIVKKVYYKKNWLREYEKNRN